MFKLIIQYNHLATNLIADVPIHYPVLSFSNLIADFGVPTCWQAESFLTHTLSTVSIVVFYLYSLLPLLFSSLLFNLFLYTLGPVLMGTFLMPRIALSSEGTYCFSKDLQKMVKTSSWVSGSLNRKKSNGKHLKALEGPGTGRLLEGP